MENDNMNHDRNQFLKGRPETEEGLADSVPVLKRGRCGKGAELFLRVLALMALFFMFLLPGVVRNERQGTGVSESLAAPANTTLPPLPGSTPPMAPPKPLMDSKPGNAGSEQLTPASPVIDSKVKQALKSGRILLNFENIDIQALTRLMSEITGRNILIGKDVHANISILSSTEVTLAQAWKMYQSVLEASGYGAVDRGKYIEILPIMDAKKAKYRYISDRPVNRRDEYVVSIVVLKEASSDALASLLKPMASNDGLIASYPQANALIISDRAEMVERLVNIVRGLDKRYRKMQLRIFHLEHASVREVGAALQSIFGQEKEAQGAGAVKITANEQTNSLIVLAYPDKFPLIEKVLRTIDREKSVTEKPTFHLYYLENGDAETIAKVLSQMLAEKKTLEERKLTETVAPAGQAVPGLTVKDERTFVSSTVSFDKDTNSLILYLTDTQYNEIKGLIAKLDAVRKQVLISAVVCEVSMTKLLQVGVKMQALSGQGATAWAGGMSQEALYSLLGSGGFVFGGVSSQGHTINISGTDTFFPDIYYVMSLLIKDTSFNLLAAPRILTLDHKKAEINVGNVIPYAGGVKYDVQGQPIISYEYKNVGLVLKVTPHVSQGQNIRLEINPTMEEITEYMKPTVGTMSYVVPVTAKREVNTTITMVEGQTIVIGGLIYKKTINTITKIPLLGDIPILGNLFRNRDKNDEKTTLFVFLTPNIIDSPDELQKITQEYNNLMQSLFKTKEMKEQLVMPTMPPYPPSEPAESPSSTAVPGETPPPAETPAPAPVPVPAPSPIPSPTQEESSIFRSGAPR
jgi:general secretion pathway protein D